MENISRKHSKQSCEKLLVDELGRLGYEIQSIPKKGNQAQEFQLKTKTGNKIIQLRTSKDGQSNYVMHQKAESLKSDELFYAFVNLNGDKLKPSFRIVPSSVVAERCRENHEKWLKGQPKRVSKRKDSTMRKFIDDEGKYLNAFHFLN